MVIAMTPKNTLASVIRPTARAGEVDKGKRGPERPAYYDCAGNVPAQGEAMARGDGERGGASAWEARVAYHIFGGSSFSVCSSNRGVSWP